MRSNLGDEKLESGNELANALHSQSCDKSLSDAGTKGSGFDNLPISVATGKSIITSTLPQFEYNG